MTSVAYTAGISFFVYSGEGERGAASRLSAQTSYTSHTQTPFEGGIEKNIGGVFLNIWHDISKERIQTDDFCAVIEIPKGCKTKYELDKGTGTLYMDRILYTSAHYPANYGFIPRTIAEDRDPLDVLVLCTEDIQSLSLVRCRPIGVIAMLDSGFVDEKIIAVPFHDPTYNAYHDITELPKHVLEEMSHFFSVYKQLEGKATAVEHIQDAQEAKKIIRVCIERYEKEYGAKE